MQLGTTVATPQQRNLRQLDYKYQDELKNAEIAQKRKNPPNFTQVTSAGWSILNKISEKSPRAFRLYSFFAENLDPNCGAVICDQKFLADHFSVGVRTIQRWISDLENLNALIKIPVGQTYAYALDPLQVWKGYNTSKEYAVFNTKTLTDRNGEINRRLKIMMSERNIDFPPAEFEQGE